MTDPVAAAAVHRRLGIGDAAADAEAALPRGDPGPDRQLVTDEVEAELVLLGPPEVIGRRLAELVCPHRPTSAGLALVHGDLVESLDRASAAFTAMRSALDAQR